MKKISLTSLILFCLIGVGSAQVAEVAPPALSKNQMLAADAYKVFETNKFLNFKNADTLNQFIDGKRYDTFDLKKFFGQKKDWAKIEREDTAYYSKNTNEYDRKKYKYSYTDTSMTETYTYLGSYEVSKNITTVYNAKGFVIHKEEKVFAKETFMETRSTQNFYDEQNRVVKIVSKLYNKRLEEQTEEIITAVYKANEVLISSKNGLISCIFNQRRVGFKPRVIHPTGQDENVYRLFNGDLSQVLLTLTLNKNELTIVGDLNAGKSISFTEKLLPTAVNNVFYFDRTKLYEAKPSKQGKYAALTLSEDKRKLELYLDTVLNSKIELDSFIGNPQNLIVALSFLMISELNLEEMKSLPSITAITKVDQLKFEALDKKRNEAIKSLPKELVNKQDQTMMKLFAKQGLIMQFNCFLIGYQPPKDRQEMDFLREFMSK